MTGDHLIENHHYVGMKPVTRAMANKIRKKFHRRVPVIKPTIQEVAPKKVYWKMSQVCDMLNVAPETIRFWLNFFNVEVYRRTGTRGYRQFTEKDIEKVKRIKFLLKVEGYTLIGAKRQFRQMRMNRSNG